MKRTSKSPRKLSIARETVRKLNVDQLLPVAGGAPPLHPYSDTNCLHCTDNTCKTY